MTTMDDHFNELFENDENFSENIARVIYAKAYDDGHAGGWSEIESKYINYSQFAIQVLNEYINNLVASQGFEIELENEEKPSTAE